MSGDLPKVLQEPVSSLSTALNPSPLPGFLSSCQFSLSSDPPFRTLLKRSSLNLVFQVASALSTYSAEHHLVLSVHLPAPHSRIQPAWPTWPWTRSPCPTQLPAHREPSVPLSALLWGSLCGVVSLVTLIRSLDPKLVSPWALFSSYLSPSAVQCSLACRPCPAPGALTQVSLPLICPNSSTIPMAVGARWQAQ